MSFRTELKMPMTSFEMYQVKEKLLSQKMKMLYPKRIIESLYFENNQLQMFHDSEEGIVPRKKIRVRHYPEQEIIDYKLEIKTSSIEGRFKTIKHINNIEHQNLIHGGYLDNQYGVCNPFLKISYTREYFTYKGIRITFDSNIVYMEPGFTNHKKNEPDCVIEIKASINDDMNFLLNLINIPQKRFSKYANGVILLNLDN